MINQLAANPLQLAFALMIAFQIKHFLADYPLQFDFMLKGKAAPGWAFVLPLSAHAGTHALFTLLICMWIEPSFWWLALVDFGVHFATDRLKAGPAFLGRYKDSHRSEFWISLGFDQMIHHLTGLYIVWVLVAR